MYFIVGILNIMQDDHNQSIMCYTNNGNYIIIVYYLYHIFTQIFDYTVYYFILFIID